MNLVSQSLLKDTEELVTQGVKKIKQISCLCQLNNIDRDIFSSEHEDLDTNPFPEMIVN